MQLTDSKEFLRQLKKNLNTLREREAKWASHPPLELLNQIEDHEQAITLTEQAARGEISEADWHTALAPLLIAVAPFRAAEQIVAILTQADASVATLALRQTALAPLHQTDKGALIATEFEQDPETYARSLVKTLAQALVSDAAFAEQLKARLVELGQAAGSKTGPYQATLTGRGSIAQGPGASAASASEGGIAIGGSVGGDVNVGKPPETD